MKKIILILVIGLLTNLWARDNTKGVHLDGMYSDHILKTQYTDSTKEHTLYTSEVYKDKPIFAIYYTKNFDGTTINGIGNYSDAGEGKTAFGIKPNPGEIYRVARLIISYKDDGVFDSGDYGNSITLTNGISGWFRQDGEDILPFTIPLQPITNNSDWAGVCYDTRVDTYGQGASQLTARWTFTRFGKFIELHGDTGDELVIYLHDDFTGLITHRFLAQGYYEVGPLP